MLFYKILIEQTHKSKWRMGLNIKFYNTKQMKMFWVKQQFELKTILDF